MPAYNCEKYVKEAVDSVIKQTYTEWELLIINDNSTDETEHIVNQLAEKDYRIKVLKNNKNCGVSKTRNRGISEANTEWIAFLDSDDKWESRKLEKQFNYLTSNPEAKFLFTGSAFINYASERISYILHVPERINRNDLLKQNLISCSSVLIKRKLLLNQLMPENALIHEDFAAWLRILMHEKYAFGIDEPLLIYRITKTSKSGNKLKSAKMNWNTYRFSGLSFKESTYYMCWYIVEGVLKYKHLR